MRRFKAGEIHVLVATTVIEVGIDVPNATVMLIEHAERFGLSQLHQLRGRVGRGPAEVVLHPAHRAAVSARTPSGASTRWSQTNDGFRIAEADLELRGPGEFFGTRQSGLPEFRVADLLRDAALLEDARAEARPSSRAIPSSREPRAPRASPGPARAVAGQARPGDRRVGSRVRIYNKYMLTAAREGSSVCTVVKLSDAPSGWGTLTARRLNAATRCREVQ